MSIGLLSASPHSFVHGTTDLQSSKSSQHSRWYIKYVSSSLDHFVYFLFTLVFPLSAMPIPDLGDRSLFPPFLELPEDHGAAVDGSSVAVGIDRVLLAQVKDNMTITKPTLVLTDRDGTGFALIFDGLERDGLDLGKQGLKKGATAVVRSARRVVPVSTGEGGETLTAKAARRPFLRVAPGQAHTVLAVPTGLDQTVAIAAKLRARQQRAQQEGQQHCEACGAAGPVTSGVITADLASASASAPADADEAVDVDVDTAAKKLLKCTGCGQAWYCDRVSLLPLLCPFLFQRLS